MTRDRMAVRSGDNECDPLTAASAVGSSDSVMGATFTVGAHSRPSFSFAANGLPRPQGSMVNNRHGGMHASDPELDRWRGIVYNAAVKAWGGRPALAGVVHLTLEFYCRITDRKRYPWMLEPDGVRYFAATVDRQDLDKLVRGVMDALTKAQIYLDDGLVSTIATVKYWADPPAFPPGVTITVAADWGIDPVSVGA